MNPSHGSSAYGDALSSFHKEKKTKETHKGGEKNVAQERSVNVPLLIGLARSVLQSRYQAESLEGMEIWSLSGICLFRLA